MRACHCPPPPRSSRPTTSGASTASRSTATSPSRSAAPSRACSRELVGKPPRRAARRPRARHAPDRAGAGRALPRRAWSPRASHVLDAGKVGTEMLYWLVGSRELDGGLMCTASHNPKAYTARSSSSEGRSRSRATRASRTSAARSRPGCRAAAGAAARSRRSTSTPTSRRPRSRFIDPSAIKPLKVVVDGGNGMAGPMVGPLLERLGPRPGRRPTGRPTATSPTTSPTRCCRRTARFIIEKVRAEGADLGIAWDGDADRCFFIDDTGSFVDGDFLTALLAESLLRKEPGRDDPLRRARQPRGARHRRAPPAAPRSSTASATPSSRRACATTGAIFGGEVSGHYYFRDFYNADSGTLPGAADPRAALDGGREAERAARAASGRSTSSPARSTPRSPTRSAKMEELERALRRRRGQPPRRRLGRLRRLALQRAPVEHRAAAAPVPRVAGLRARTWSGGATRCSALIRS